MRSLLYFLCLGLGFVLPGWLLGRVLRTRAGLAGTILASAVLVMYGLLALDAFHVRLSVGPVTLGLVAISGLLAAVAWWRSSPWPATEPAKPNHWTWQHHHWLALPAALGLGALAWRVCVDPLSGADTGFRWSFLAEQMLRSGRLDFYPPVSADDYRVYGWTDGIAPIVSGLYFLSYAGIGAAASWTTIPVVLLQAAALYATVYRLAERNAGPAAGWCAVGILGSNFVLLHGVAIGQETGFTALALVAMLNFIDQHFREPDRPWLVWAGIAAGAGALAREYGMIFPVLGLVTLGWRRAPWRSMLTLSGIALLVAAPWYTLNWLKTGNPVYSYDVAGWFPTNLAHQDNFRAVTEVLGVRSHPGAVSFLIQTVALLGGLPLILAVIGSVRVGRLAWTWLTSVAVMVAVWLWTAGQTGGGYVYSLRVLTPALALAAALGGWGLASWARSRRAWILTLLLVAATVDATARLSLMPPDPTGPWWRQRTGTWRLHRDAAQAWHDSPAWAAIAEAAQGQKILCTDPYDYADLARRRAQTVPLFSPEVQFLLGPSADFPALLGELHRRQFRFIIVSRDNAVTDRQLSRYAFFRALRECPLARSTALYFLYDIEQLAAGENNDGKTTGSAKKP